MTSIYTLPDNGVWRSNEYDRRQRPRWRL